MNIIDIETKFANSCEFNNLQKIEEKINKELDFWGTDGVRVCIILKDTKDIFYFKPFNKEKYELFFLVSNQEYELYSCGIYNNKDLKSISNILNGNVDRRINNGVLNDYLGE